MLSLMWNRHKWVSYGLRLVRYVVCMNGFINFSKARPGRSPYVPAIVGTLTNPDAGVKKYVAL